MTKKTRSLPSVKKRNILLIAPLLAVPFITILFWLLGGGKMQNARAQTVEKAGFNRALPKPMLQDDDPLNKMSYYDQATQDATKMEERMKKDPNYLRYALLGDSMGSASDRNRGSENLRIKSSGLNTDTYPDSNEEKVYQRLETLQRIVTAPRTAVRQPRDFAQFESRSSAGIDSKEVDRLEQMMHAMNQSDAEDPELEKLNGMIENILDIQHPDRVREKLRKTAESNKGEVYAVAAVAHEDGVTFLQSSKNRTVDHAGILSSFNAFYALEESLNVPPLQNAMEAVVHETQTLVNGSTVKLRLTNAIFINEVLIPKGHFLFGIAALKGERLHVKINSFRYGNSLFQVELSVYDKDGLEGVYIPGAITRDVAKTAADRSVQTFGVPALDDSWGAQAAGAGIEAAKNLLSKKVKLVKVTVKSGYQLLIHDENQKKEDFQ